jgi:hypothetical protein
MQNDLVGQATESMALKRRGVLTTAQVVPPSVVRTMRAAYPTTRHTLIDAHAAPSTPPTIGRVPLAQWAPPSVVENTKGCSMRGVELTSGAGCPLGSVSGFSPATTHVLGLGHAISKSCAPSDVVNNGSPT